MKPEIKQNIDLNNLIKVLQKHVDYVASEDYHEDNDDTHYIYEEVMETFYGKEFFKFLKEQMKYN